MLYQDEKYTPPSGQKLKITVKWKDKDGKLHEANAKKWVRSATQRYFVEKLDIAAGGRENPRRQRNAVRQKVQGAGVVRLHERKSSATTTSKQTDDKAFQKAIKSIYKRSQPREMTADWVFTGSGFYVETEGPDKGKKYYKAEGGEVICVANFPSAMIDVNEESTSSGEANLLYEAWTERIPPLETPVTVEISPIVKKKKTP